jgi:hypothetical protein
MVEGIWSIAFGKVLGKYLNMEKGGIVVLKGQEIFGGDNNHYYVGMYEIKADEIQGEIEVNYYGRNMLQTFKGGIFGAERKFRVSFSGKVHIGVLELQGYVIKDPDKKMALGLTKRAELP